MFPTGRAGAVQWTSEEDGLGAAWHFSWTATPQATLLVCPARPPHPEGKAREINDPGQCTERQQQRAASHRLPIPHLVLLICALGTREKKTHKAG